MMIKVCGITSVHDALLAESLGADWIGMIFEPTSKRYVTLETARAISDALTRARSIGVFVNDSIPAIKSSAAAAHLSGVQLYYPVREQIENLIVIEAMLVGDHFDHENFLNSKADYVLCDAVSDGKFGGRGLQFNWQLLPKHRERLILSGGLHADNVSAALQEQCFGIDVCSGVESSPGVKDPKRLQLFFDRIRNTHERAS